MPLYEYECNDNGHRFERIQKFSDPPIAVCPTCGSAVRKLLSSPAIQFKGTGWYITDYAKRSGSVESSSSSSSSNKGDSGEKKSESSDKSSTSSESKPASTPSKND